MIEITKSENPNSLPRIVRRVGQQPIGHHQHQHAQKQGPVFKKCAFHAPAIARHKEDFAPDPDIRVGSRHRRTHNGLRLFAGNYPATRFAM